MQVGAETNTTAAADGSAESDAREIVVIESNDDVDRMRYRCPRGHTRWEPTNNHLYCNSCADQSAHDDSVNPEHWELHDAKTGEEIPWSRVDLR